MTLKPLGDRVLVKPAPKEEKTSSGLYISSGAQEKPQRGEVVAVGAGKVNDKGERVAMDVKVGDQVCITQLLTQALHIPDDQLHRAGMRRTEKAVSAALDNYPGLERRGQQRLHPYGRVTAWRMIREEASA